jgi:hypothetical protein
LWRFGLPPGAGARPKKMKKKSVILAADITSLEPRIL